MSGVELLRTTLAAERLRRRQLEREVLAARSALARTRAELVGTREGERQARHLSLHDGLTSLPNRRFFHLQLDQALARASPEAPALAVLFLDLDHFKPVNDQYGHEAGDELLRIIATRLSRAVRAEDTMSRLGGDEFACLVADFLNRRTLSQLARKLISTVSAPLKLGTQSLSVRPSIGIAMYPADGTTADDLLRSADAAMYTAKQQHASYQFCDRRTGVSATAAPACGWSAREPAAGRVPMTS